MLQGSISAGFSTAEESPTFGVSPTSSSDGGRMFMTLAYAIALAEARSCLAALAGRRGQTSTSQSTTSTCSSTSTDSTRFGPALDADSGGTKAELLDRLEAAVDQMLDLGEGDGLSLELLLAAALLSDGPGVGLRTTHSMPVTWGRSSMTLSDDDCSVRSGADVGIELHDMECASVHDLQCHRDHTLDPLSSDSGASQELSGCSLDLRNVNPLSSSLGLDGEKPALAGLIDEVVGSIHLAVAQLDASL